MLVSPSDMVLFAVVVREGGFTRAAKVLGLTKQTVSERIGKLEARLGVRLLERTTRRIRVTDSGADYYERCNRIATEIDEANDAVQRRTAEPVGLLRVSSPMLYGRRFLAPVVSHYLERWPQARVEIVLSDRRVDLIAEGIDLAIRVGELDDSSLSARKLGEGHMYYVASPKFLAAHGTPTTRTLHSARCIGQRAFESWEGTKIEPVLVVNDLEVACAAAIAGVGIARLPGLVCRQAVLDRSLRLLFRPEPVVRPVYAVFPSRQYLPAKVRVFIEALATLVEPMAPLDRTARARA